MVSQEDWHTSVQAFLIEMNTIWNTGQPKQMAHLDNQIWLQCLGG